MSVHDTARVMRHGSAPAQLTLMGRPEITPEPAEHIIEFPGGAISLTRTDDGDYWAHIHAHRGQVLPESKGLVAAPGRVVGSRIDYVWSPGPSAPVPCIPHEGDVEHIAVRIRTGAA